MALDADAAAARAPIRDRQPSAAPIRMPVYAGLAAALAVGALVRFWHLGSQSLFLDEAFTFDAAGRSVHDLLVQIAGHDAHPPLFYLMTHWLMAAFPRLPEQSYRWFTAPLGLATIAASWGIARRRFGEAAAIVTALVVATEPSVVQLDRLYRMYALLTALTAVSWWLLVAMEDATGAARRSYGIAYVIAAALLPSVQYLGGAVILSQLAYAAYRWVTGRRAAGSGPSPGPSLVAATVAGAAAAAAALSWWVVWALPTQFHQGGYAGAGSVTQTWWEIPSGALGYGLPAEWYHDPSFAAGFAAAVIALALAGAWLGRATILPWYLAPVALQAIFTGATGKDLVLSRYLIHIVPAFGIALGAIAAAIFRTRYRAAGLCLALVAVAVNGVALTDELLDPVYQTPDWNMVGTIVAQHERQGDRIVLDDGYPYLILRAMPAFAGRATNAPTQSWQIAQTVRWIDAAPGSRIWYVENQFYYPDPGRLILAHLSSERPRLAQWLEPRADLSNRVYIALFGAVREHRR
jgi:hypothetical protein